MLHRSVRCSFMAAKTRGMSRSGPPPDSSAILRRVPHRRAGRSSEFSSSRRLEETGTPFLQQRSQEKHQGEQDDRPKNPGDERLGVILRPAQLQRACDLVFLFLHRETQFFHVGQNVRLVARRNIRVSEDPADLAIRIPFCALQLFDVDFDPPFLPFRSEERRVGKECRARWWWCRERMTGSWSGEWKRSETG